MDTEQILKKIRSEWQKQIDADSLVREVRKKIKGKTATYADADSLAVRAGKILSDLFREYLPDATVGGQLYRETADILIRRPLMDNYHLIADQAEKLQQALNEAAGIGINVIVPDANKAQIDGIIHGISTARNYEHYEESFLDQIENFGEGVVDDFVRENADFQYHAGLSPTIERKTDGKCCPWCSALAGTYLYEDVRNAGNDVFRRHKNCHCQVLFNPGDGSKRRQNVHSRQWTDESNPDIISRRSRIPLNLQQFAHKTGDYRSQMHQYNWPEASLKDTIKRLTPHATVSERKEKGKVFYDGADGKYQIVYDRNGNYFRILDKHSKSKKRPYVGLNGESLLNKVENGRTIGRSKEEYEAVSHFHNTDK